jgi:hypothetical protein
MCLNRLSLEGTEEACLDVVELIVNTVGLCVPKLAVECYGMCVGYESAAAM